MVMVLMSKVTVVAAAAAAVPVAAVMVLLLQTEAGNLVVLAHILAVAVEMVVRVGFRMITERMAALPVAVAVAATITMIMVLALPVR